MKSIVIALFCGLVLIVLTGSTIPRKLNAQVTIPADKSLVVTLRALTTEQFDYMDKNHRFADRGQILAYLREEEPGLLRKLPIDLENPKSFELLINTSADGLHYQITLRHHPQLDDKKVTQCQNAAFSDDNALIYLGRPLGCDPESTGY
jgi:hypothetical protein